jgi:stage II sporulation protein D
MRTLRRSTALAAVLSFAAGTLAVLSTSTGPAQAAEDYVRPAGGVFYVEGHGWGHGRGMSQWGAQGAAITGVGYRKILSTYYTNTAIGTIGGRMRVRMTADTGRDVVVSPVSGLTVRDLSTRTSYPLPTVSGTTRWRLLVSSDGMRVQRYDGRWHTWAAGDKSLFSGPLQFQGAKLLRLHLPDGSARDVRGVLRAVRMGALSAATVNDLTMEHYLRGVVPRESPAFFHPEALKAQAVAARSYSGYKRDHVPSGSKWDICDTVMCQVYGGVRLIKASGTVVQLEQASTNAAVAATAGEVRTYGGRPIFAEFSSSSGGWSRASTQFPYLAARPDPYDGLDKRNTSHHWRGQISVAQLERAFPKVGSLRRLRITRRDGNGEWGGRVTEVVLEGVSRTGYATSVTTDGSGIFHANEWPGSRTGMRGRWFRIIPVPNASVVSTTASPFTLVQPPGVAAKNVYAVVRNTGTSTWTTSGLHLTVAAADGQPDPLSKDDTTPGTFLGNLTRPGATTVRPGERARFRVRIDGTGLAVGRHSQRYQVRIGAGKGFGAPFGWTVDVKAPVFTGTVVAASQDVAVPVSGTAPVYFDVTNTGNVAWPVGGQVRARAYTPGGSPSYHEPSWRSRYQVGPVTANLTRPGATSVAPGEVARFAFRLAGNGRPAGAYSEQFGVRWYTFSTMPARLTLRYTLR